MAGLDAYNAAATALGGQSVGTQPNGSDQLLGSLSMGLGTSDGMAGSNSLIAGIPGESSQSIDTFQANKTYTVFAHQARVRQQTLRAMTLCHLGFHELVTETWASEG